MSIQASGLVPANPPHHQRQTSVWIAEVSEVERRFFPPAMPLDYFPYCFDSAADLLMEVLDTSQVLSARKDISAESPQQMRLWAFIEVINKDRGVCPGFIRLRRGLTAKEHREMLDRQWMIDREREWRETDQKVQGKMVRASYLGALAQFGTVLVGIVAIFVAARCGSITVKDGRSSIPTVVVNVPAPVVNNQIVIPTPASP